MSLTTREYGILRCVFSVYPIVGGTPAFIVVAAAIAVVTVLLVRLRRYVYMLFKVAGIYSKKTNKTFGVCAKDLFQNAPYTKQPTQ